MQDFIHYRRNAQQLKALKKEYHATTKELTNLKLCVQEDQGVRVSTIAKRLLYTNLNHKHVYLIDFENIADIPTFIVNDKQGVCYIFIGVTQREKINQFELTHDFQGQHYKIQIQKTRKNKLDTLLSFYLGQIYCSYEPNSIYVVSNDSDYENLKEIALLYPAIHYEQITLNSLLRYELNTKSDTFYKRFLLDYISIYCAALVHRNIFLKRLRGSKVKGMGIVESQLAIHRMVQLELIEECTYQGAKYIRLLVDNIQRLSTSIIKVNKAYVY